MSMCHRMEKLDLTEYLTDCLEEGDVLYLCCEYQDKLLYINC